MKKIAFIIKLFQQESFHGGGEKLFYNLIKRFSSSGCEIDIYCSKKILTADFQPQNDGILNIYQINKEYDHLKPETMEAFYEEVENQIKDKNYDFVISENITPPVDITFLQGHSLANRLKRDKNSFEAFFYNFRKVKAERMKFQKKWMQEGYRKIFTVSEVLKKDIMENFGVSQDKISVIYPGVDIPLNRHVEERSDVRICFGLSAPGFKIKGGYIFLKALCILKTHKYKFKAKIIYPKYKNNLGVKLLLKLFNIEKNVEFLPFQKDMSEFYSSIDCLVAPSIEDTFNLAVLEAMAHKKPCIVSTNAGASEIIKDGQNGYIFEMKGSPEKNLAEKLVLFINNFENSSELREKAFETAKYYSWQRTFEQFQEELCNLEKK